MSGRSAEFLDAIEKCITTAGRSPPQVAQTWLELADSYRFLLALEHRYPSAENAPASATVQENGGGEPASQT
ncbi:MAG: hypothetical protein JO245_09125 [Pseudolabrys sp.]|nr:hypothetical protein [Pseudolabrys sp.]